MARFTGSSGGGSGAPGPQGPAGDSAYDIAVENGFVGTEQEWLDSFGGTANIADFVFNYDEEDTNSTITIHNHDMVIQTTRDSDEDSDISLNSADDIWINATDDIEVTAANSIYLNAVNGVYLGTADEEEYNPNNQVATIGDIQQGTTGDITFSGVQIIGAGTAAGDGSGNGTMELVPDGDLTSNQYLIIDPTGPNHIHIRAGGNIDESTADLILGGERNKVAVSDSYKSVAITTAATITNTYVNAHEADNEDLIVPETSDILIGDSIVIAGINHPVTYFSPDPNNTGFSIVRATGLTFVAGESYTFVREEPYENSWQFGSDGVLYGPAMGVVKVPAIANTGPDNDLYIYAYGANADLRLVADQDIRLATEYGNVVLNADGGEFIGSSGSPENQIATIGDIDNIVSNGTVRYSPTFTATGLEFTGSGETYPTYNSYYIKAGQMVSFVIEVDLSTVTNFGTGQYKLELPVDPAFGYNHFTGWANVDTAVNPDVTDGHVVLNVDHAGITSTLDLHYLKQAGGAHTPIIEGLFLQGTPVTLTTSSKIYINGTYIMQGLP